MTRFFIVRHGQTEWNRIERFRGRADVPLNETGVAQARAVAERLAAESIAAVFSSPLGRTLRTAEAIGQKHNLPVQVAEELIDLDYGEWQGRTPEEVAKAYPEAYAHWLSHPETAAIPGGESLDNVRGRVLRLIDDLAERYQNQGVVLVTHKVVCKILLCVALEIDNSHILHLEQDNGAVSVFEWDKKLGFVVSLINDTCHLRGLG